MEFKQYLNEAVKKAKKKEEEESTAVMSFGRFNPPTIGHEKLIQKTEEVAQQHGGTAHIVASHSEGTAKNPVPQKAKLGYLHSIVKPGTELSGSSKEAPTIFHHAARLYKQGHTHLVVVAGSDRVQQYQRDLDQYNDGNQYPHGSYKFKSIKVLSAGQRDPDAEGIAGMSGTKIRDYARKGNTAKFRAALPDNLKANAEEIMGHIKAVPLKEEIDPIREAYINKQIYKINDMVEAKNGDKGPIVFRGSTYVTIQLAEGKTVKHWIKDIKESIVHKPEIIIKHRRLMEKQIPALFMPKLDNIKSKEPEQVESKETITVSNVRKRINEINNTKMSNQDINLRPDREVYNGIDKNIEDQGHPEKPLGLVSFKSFMSSSEAQQIQKHKEEEIEHNNKEKNELAIYSPAYKQMIKQHRID